MPTWLSDSVPQILVTYYSGCVCWRTQRWLRIEDVKDSRWRPAKWRDGHLPQWVGRVLFQHPRSCFGEVKTPGTIVIESTEVHFQYIHTKAFPKFTTNGSQKGWGTYCRKYLNSFTYNSSLVQFSSVAQSCLTLCDPRNCSMPELPIHHQLLESTQTHVQWNGDAIQLSHPLSSPLLLPSIFPSIRVFSNESALCIRWPKYWSFSFNISPSNGHPGLISFRMDWLDLLAVQGTLKSLLQHHSSKASILWCSAFFIVQLSHPYMATGKTIALTRWTFVDKVMSLLFNMLSRLVITFLLRSKRLLISWLQSPSAVILEPPQK